MAAPGGPAIDLKLNLSGAGGSDLGSLESSRSMIGDSKSNSNPSGAGSTGTGSGGSGGTGSGGSKIIHLNVGGQRFSTYRSTLIKYKDSMLYAMFAGSFPIQSESDGSYFIDRDPTHFRTILNYLRDGPAVQLPDFHRVLIHASPDFAKVPRDEAHLGGNSGADEMKWFVHYRELATEAHFYGLTGLLSVMFDPYVTCNIANCPSKRIRSSIFFAPANSAEAVPCAPKMNHSLLPSGGRLQYTTKPTLLSPLLLRWHWDTFGSAAAAK